MFLVSLPTGHSAQWLFLHCDPQADGCPYEAVADVDFEDDGLALGAFDGDDVAEPVLGRAPHNARVYKRFQNYRRLKLDGFDYLPGAALELSSWRAFVAAAPKPAPATVIGEGATARDGKSRGSPDARRRGDP